MANIVALGDATSHDTVITTEPLNTKITVSNIKLCLLGAIGMVHSKTHEPGTNIDIIINPINKKITFANIPFAVYGAVCTCGAEVKGSKINKKIFIK